MSDTEKPSTPRAGTQPGRVIAARSQGSRRWQNVGLVAGITVCLFSMLLGTMAGHLYWNSDVLRTLLRGHTLTTVGNILTGRGYDADWSTDKQFPGLGEINVLVLGCDYDYDDYGRVVKSNARSDAILVARLDFIGRRISALTIPRDTAVNIPGHRGIHKINAAHAFGGPQLTAETIKTVFGINVDHYVVLNFQGFVRLVDAIGGIDVNVKKKLDYDDNWGHLHIHLKPGYQHLDGYRAMGYVRMRHSDSDVMRSERQHEFLEAVRQKLRKPTTFAALPKVIDTLNRSLARDLTDDQMFALMKFAKDLPRDNVQVVTLPSYEGPSYVSVDNDKAAELIQQMFYPNQMVALAVDAPDPNSVRSMNARYERGHSRHTKHHGKRTKPTKAEDESSDSEQAPPATGELSVEPTPSDGGSGSSGDPGGSGGAGDESRPPSDPSGGSGGKVGPAG